MGSYEQNNKTLVSIQRRKSTELLGNCQRLRGLKGENVCKIMYVPHRNWELTAGLTNRCSLWSSFREPWFMADCLIEVVSGEQWRRRDLLLTASRDWWMRLVQRHEWLQGDQYNIKTVSGPRGYFGDWRGEGINGIELKSRLCVVHVQIMPKPTPDTVTFQHIKDNRFGVGKKEERKFVEKEPFW